ncbi:hypothetical protein V1478_000676 [Vespula squamosa]|uniref:Uncharacterized protein n=1 Tax=Vespula squamosa TaxID=30214 RepID=A0ABD2C673_VESSQ
MKNTKDTMTTSTPSRSSDSFNLHVLADASIRLSNHNVNVKANNSDRSEPITITQELPEREETFFQRNNNNSER